MNRRRVVGLAVLSIAAGGCAVPYVAPRGGRSRPRRRSRPRSRPSRPRARRRHRRPLPTPPTPKAKPEPDRLEPLYRAATAHIAERRDDQAYRALIQIVRVNPQYRDCPTLLRDVRTRLARSHYQEGLRLFREEKLEAAIVEWRVVLEMDPAHANARRNIDQAEQILRTLAEHQRR